MCYTVFLPWKISFSFINPIEDLFTSHQLYSHDRHSMANTLGSVMYQNIMLPVVCVCVFLLMCFVQKKDGFSCVISVTRVFISMRITQLYLYENFAYRYFVWNHSKFSVIIFRKIIPCTEFYSRINLKLTMRTHAKNIIYWNI